MFSPTNKFSRSTVFTAPSLPIKNGRLFAAPRFHVTKGTLLQQRARPFLLSGKCSPNKRKLECSTACSIKDNPFFLAPPWKKQLFAAEEMKAGQNTSTVSQIPSLSSLSSTSIDPLVEYMNSFVKDPKFRLQPQSQSSSNCRRSFRARRRLIFYPTEMTPFAQTAAQNEVPSDSATYKHVQIHVFQGNPPAGEIAQQYEALCTNNATLSEQRSILSPHDSQYCPLPLEHYPFYRPPKEVPGQQPRQSGIYYARRDPRQVFNADDV